jgi:hypothetical protein
MERIDTLGGNTDDLHRLGRLPLTETPTTDPGIQDRERLVNRYGRRCCIAGASLILGPLPCAAYTAVVNPSLHEWPDGLLILAISALTACMTAGGVLMSVGAIEFLTRYVRTLSRKALAGQQKRGQMIDGLTRMVEDLGPHLARISSQQDELARIGHAIDLIAEHLPEDQQLRHWRGFSAAVKQGFAEHTGTEGSGIPAPRIRPAHLGIVRPGDSPKS